MGFATQAIDHRRHVVTLTAVVLAAFAPCRVPLAHGLDSTVSGVVTATEPVGTPVAGAFVALTGDDGQHTAVTDESGAFSLSGVGDGSYTLVAQAPGYAVGTAAGVTVAGSNLEQNVSLTPSAAVFTALGVYGAQIASLAADGESGIFYASTSVIPQLFRSADFGGSWTQVTMGLDDADEGLPSTNVGGGLTTSGFPGELAVNVQGTIYASTDFGVTWFSVPMPQGGGGGRRSGERQPLLGARRFHQRPPQRLADRRLPRRHERGQPELHADVGVVPRLRERQDGRRHRRRRRLGGGRGHERRPRDLRPRQRPARVAHLDALRPSPPADLRPSRRHEERRRAARRAAGLLARRQQPGGDGHQDRRHHVRLRQRRDHRQRRLRRRSRVDRLGRIAVDRRRRQRHDLAVLDHQERHRQPDATVGARHQQQHRSGVRRRLRRLHQRGHAVGDGNRGVVKSAQKQGGVPQFPMTPATASAGTDPNSGGVAVDGITVPVVKDTAFGPAGATQIAVSLSPSGGGLSVGSDDGGTTFVPVVYKGGKRRPGGPAAAGRGSRSAMPARATS